MITIKGNDFSNAWAEAIRKVMIYGRDMPADGKRNVMTKDEYVIFELGECAIQQMLDGVIHEHGAQHLGLDIYINQFIDGTDAAIKSKGSQTYTYMGRTLSQLQKIKNDNLLDEPFNRRVQVVTWDKFEDLGSQNPPCWQIANIRNIGNNEAEISMHYRSHDLFSAWQFNNIALMQYINREVLEPAGLTPVLFRESNVSGHIYNYDFVKAKLVCAEPAALTRRYE
jgi:thymidylate synthase